MTLIDLTHPRSGAAWLRTGLPGTQRRSRRRSIITGILVVLAGIAWWFTLAPTFLGGPVGVVVVDGTSMEPRFHTGDVVLVYRQPSYHVGETVVADVDGGKVVHPLYAGNAHIGWRTKGINRRSADSWVIPERHIVGSYWFMIPKAGSWLSTLRTSTGTGALCAAVGFLAIAVPAGRRRSRSHRTLGQQMRITQKAAEATGNDAAPYRPTTPGRWAAPALTAAGALTVACVAADLGAWLPAHGVLARFPLHLHGAAAIAVLVATALVLVVDGLLAARILWAWRGSDVDQACARFRDRLVSVRALDLDGSVANVLTARELHRIAKLCVAPILHCHRENGDVFAVADGTMTYLYEPTPPTPRWAIDLRDGATAPIIELSS